MTAHGSRKRVQAQPSCRPKVILSKEARAALTAQRHDKSHCFKTALCSAWNGLDETVKTLASSHHKSFRRVQNELCMGRGMMRYQRSKLNAWNAFCWKKRLDTGLGDKENGATGKAVLQELVKDGDNRAEYHHLTEVQKAQLLEEYGKHKEMKSTGIRISTRSKVGNVTQTLKAIENELNNLRARTGVETILYTTRGSTDLPLRGIAFATEGVDDFMGSVMNIDNQDLVSRMEGFSVQGMKGAAKNHQNRTSKVCGAIRQQINTTLQQITDEPKARMHWANYWCSVVQRYLVIIEGWPASIPFVNLSSVSSALPELEMLLHMWQSGIIHWRHLDEDEYEKLLQERHEKIDKGSIVERRRHTHSDKGKKRSQNSADSGASHHRKVYKSAAVVASSEDEDKDEAPSSCNLNTTTANSSHAHPPAINAPSETSPLVPPTIVANRPLTVAADCE